MEIFDQIQWYYIGFKICVTPFNYYRLQLNPRTSDVNYNHSVFKLAHVQPIVKIWLQYLRTDMCWT